MKKIVYIILVFLFSGIMVSCGDRKESVLGEKIIEEEIVEEIQNEDGLCFNIKGAEGEEENYVIMPENGMFFMELESGGKDERTVSLQVLLDYKQIPIIIDDKEYETYTIHTNDNFSIEKSFFFAEDIDTSVNHKMTVIVTRDSEKNAGSVSEEYHRLYGNSLIIDTYLMISPENKLYRSNVYKELKELYEENTFSGISFTQEGGKKRKVMDLNTIVPCGENLEIFFHAGGYEESEEVLIFMNNGMKQESIDGQDYILCKTGNKKIGRGICKIQIPNQAGKYDRMGIIVNNPFIEVDQRRTRWETLDFDFRFTLDVVE